MVVYLEEMKRDTSDFGEDLLINFFQVFLFEEFLASQTIDNKKMACDGEGKYNLSLMSTCIIRK